MTTAPTSHSGLRPGHFMRVSWMRVRAEVVQYFRRPDTLVFTFLFPVVLFLIFSSAFGSLPDLVPAIGADPAITQTMYYVPAMIASGLFLTGVQNMGIEIATERGNGTLKRLQGSPVPAGAYFVGKIGLLLLTSLCQAALLMAVAGIGYGVALPVAPEKWLVFAAGFVLALITFGLLGILIGQVPRSAAAASAVVIPPVLAFQFVSGIFVAFTLLPQWLQTIANLFPLAWVGHIMRYVFLPETGALIEVDERYNLPSAFLMLGIWAVGALLLTLLTFRWTRKDQ